MANVNSKVLGEDKPYAGLLSHRDGVLGKRLCARIVVEATYTLGGPQT